MESATDKTVLITSYFSKHGILLCNDNKELPSIFTVGGDWNTIVSLIESRDVFYSKLYKGRVTYLSKEFYRQIKPYRHRTKKLSSKSLEIYNLLSSLEQATTTEIKNILMLSGKTFTKSMDELLGELLITAIQRDKTMNHSWSSFCWGTYAAWEKAASLSDKPTSIQEVRRLLMPLLSDKQIDRLLNMH